MALFATVVDQLISALLHPSSAGSSVTVDQIVPLAEAVQTIEETTRTVFQEADAQTESMDLNVKDAGADVAQIGDDLKSITQHTYEVVIPHSLAWLLGHIVKNYISPINHRLDKDESSIAFLLGSVHKLNLWRDQLVDPQIALWQAVDQWVAWFADPHAFALWAAGPLVGPLINYFADPSHQQSRDNLMLIMVQGMAEDANASWGLVQNWLVAGT